MKVLILGAAAHTDEAEAPPVWLAEQSGELLVQRFVRACAGLDAQLVFAMRADDIRRFRLDSVVAMAAPGSAVVSVRGNTAGAACTALSCISHLDPAGELLIMSGNEIVDADFAAVVAEFRARGLDAGVLVFDALHPRYSYVRLDKDDLVMEAAEKNPISRNAMAGWIWYRQARDFIEAAQTMIRKDAQVDGSFFVSLTLNEMVLLQRRVGVHRIPTSQYRPLKLRRQVLDYEAEHERAAP